MTVFAGDMVKNGSTAQAERIIEAVETIKKAMAALDKEYRITLNSTDIADAVDGWVTTPDELLSSTKMRSVTRSA